MGGDSNRPRRSGGPAVSGRSVRLNLLITRDESQENNRAATSFAPLRYHVLAQKHMD